MNGVIKRVGLVEVSANQLAAHCHGCKKSLTYPYGTRLSAWNIKLKSFIKTHKMCKEKT